MDLSEEDFLVLTEVEAKFAENQIQILALTLFQELISSYLQNVFSVDEGVNVDKDSFFTLGLCSLNNCFSFLAVTRSEVDSSIVDGKKIGDQLRETVHNIEINHMVSDF